MLKINNISFNTTFGAQRTQSHGDKMVFRTTDASEDGAAWQASIKCTNSSECAKNYWQATFTENKKKQAKFKKQIHKAQKEPVELKPKKDAKRLFNDIIKIESEFWSDIFKRPPNEQELNHIRLRMDRLKQDEQKNQNYVKYYEKRVSYFENASDLQTGLEESNESARLRSEGKGMQNTLKQHKKDAILYPIAMELLETISSEYEEYYKTGKVPPDIDKHFMLVAKELIRNKKDELNELNNI